LISSGIVDEWLERDGGERRRININNGWEDELKT
jgi:hypothetical protein